MMQNRLSTFSFKKLIKVIFTIFLCILFTVLLDRLFMPKYVNENLDGRITPEFYRADKDLDVIFLGSSTVYNAIVPSKLYEDTSSKVYLRANASQTLWQSYYLLEDALADHQPKLVALDVSFMKNGEEFIEEPSNRKAIEGMRPSLSKIKAIKASQYEEEHVETYFFPVYRYHSRWKDLKKEDFEYLFYQELSNDTSWLPDFDRTQPFSNSLATPVWHWKKGFIV